jgi:UDP-glucuronate decarboxylase
MTQPRFEMLRHDVTFPLYLEVDRIYNLACPASPIHYQFDPVQTTKTSVHGAIDMLGLAKRVKARILQASTSEVYGDPEIPPQIESYWGRVNSIGLRSCYDEGKRCAETLFFDYWRQHQLRIKVVRIFNTYGPRMHPNDGRVVSNFIVQALRGDDITIYGDGMQTRSFCYVDDMVEAMVRAMNTPDEFIGPVNIGNPKEFTMLQLAELVLKLTRSKSQLVFKPLPSDDPRQRQPDISLAKKVLGWSPTTELEQGLERTMRYFKDQPPSEVRRSVDRCAGCLWPEQDALQPLCTMGGERRVERHLPCSGTGRWPTGGGSDRQFGGQGAPLRLRREKGEQNQAIGRSRGGRTTKIHALTDSACRPIAFMLTGGQVADCTRRLLLQQMPQASMLHGDKGYDSNAIRRQVEDKGAMPDIPPKANRRWKNCFSPFLYRNRNAIERMFGRLKDFRRIATRYDRLSSNFLAAILQ